jgi:hypothetical protein
LRLLRYVGRHVLRAAAAEPQLEADTMAHMALCTAGTTSLCSDGHGIHTVSAMAAVCALYSTKACSSTACQGCSAHCTAARRTASIASQATNHSIPGAYLRAERRVGPDSSRAVASAACRLAWLACSTCCCATSVHTGLCRRPATYRCRHVSRSSTASEVEITPYLISCKGKQPAHEAGQLIAGTCNDAAGDGTLSSTSWPSQTRCCRCSYERGLCMHAAVQAGIACMQLCRAHLPLHRYQCVEVHTSTHLAG